jgi:hypothetical protein
MTDSIPIYNEQMFWCEVIDELQRARVKLPTTESISTIFALTEEVGELLRDVLQQRFESDKYRGYGELRKEAVQVAVMAIRVALDCELAPVALDCELAPGQFELPLIAS